MAIPLNQFTNPPVVSDYLEPLDEAYQPLFMHAPGGVAIGDGSQGREVQIWSVSYDGTDIVIKNEAGVTEYTLTVPGVLTVCLAFDSNMAVALAYMKADGGYLYFYNGVINDYQTNHYPEVTSCRVAVDKTSRFFEAQSDVVFGYVKDGTSACYRYQRDRYDIEYTISPAPNLTALNPLIKLGPSEGNRLQFEFFVSSNPPSPTPLGPAFQRPLPTLPLWRVVRTTPEHS